MLCYVLLPRTENRTEKQFSQNKVELLRENLGLETKSKEEAENYNSWQHKTQAELRQLSNEQLKTICKSYGRPFSNKNKEKLIETAFMGPLVSQSITKVEKILKYSFLQPLSQQDRSAHKLDR